MSSRVPVKILRVEGWGISRFRSTVAEIARRRQRLQTSPSGPRTVTFRFDDGDEIWWHEQGGDAIAGFSATSYEAGGAAGEPESGGPAVSD